MQIMQNRHSIAHWDIFYIEAIFQAPLMVCFESLSHLFWKLKARMYFNFVHFCYAMFMLDQCVSWSGKHSMMLKKHLQSSPLFEDNRQENELRMGTINEFAKTIERKSFSQRKDGVVEEDSLQHEPPSAMTEKDDGLTSSEPSSSH